MVFCSKCGTMMGSNGKFCPNCGQTVNLENHAPNVNRIPSTSPSYPQRPTSSTSFLQNNYQQNSSQSGLVTGAYICAAISLLFIPILFGPIGVILGVIANSNGDERGSTAAIISGICTVVGMVIGILVFAAFL